MSAYGLKIATGYKASLDMYGDRMLLCADVTPKLFNCATVWDQMFKIYSDNGRSYKQNCWEKFVGNTVMTNYNQKSYRIDDIAWDVRPSDT